jgi:hypothetical protein
LLCSLFGNALAGPLERLQRIGPIRIAMTVSALRQAVGPAAHEGDPEVDAPSGWTMQSWSYPNYGLNVRLATDTSQRGTSKVWGFTAKAPCRWKTPEGIGIGSPRQQVEAAYPDQINRKASSEGQILVGKSHDGIIFSFKNGIVVRIDVGPGAL